MFKFILELKNNGKVSVERRINNGLRHMGERVYSSSDYKVGIYSNRNGAVNKIAIYTQSPEYVQECVRMFTCFLKSDLNRLGVDDINNINTILEYINEEIEND